MQVYEIVKITATGDSDILDSVEDELPATDADGLSDTYEGPTRLTSSDTGALSEGQERLTVTVPYESQSDATTLFDAVESVLNDSDIASAEVLQYVSPVRAVKSDEVRSWYEDNPDEQPTDEDGESYVPSSWDPMNHLVSEMRL